MLRYPSWSRGNRTAVVGGKPPLGVGSVVGWLLLLLLLDVAVVVVIVSGLLLLDVDADFVIVVVVVIGDVVNVQADFVIGWVDVNGFKVVVIGVNVHGEMHLLVVVGVEVDDNLTEGFRGCRDDVVCTRSTRRRFSTAALLQLFCLVHLGASNFFQFPAVLWINESRYLLLET